MIRLIFPLTVIACPLMWLLILTALNIGIRLGADVIVFSASTNMIVMDIQRNLYIPLLSSDRASDYQWSPDGQQIVAVIQDDLYLIDFPAELPRYLTSWQGVHHTPRYSPDGRFIAYITWDNEAFLYLMEADGSSPRMIGRWLYNQQYAWSPDGTQIAYIRAEQDGRTRSIYLIDVPYGVPQLLTNSFPLADTLHWLPDGLVVGDVHGLWHLSTGASWNFAAPVWSPDGTRFIFQAVTSTQESDLMLVTANGVIPLTDAPGLDMRPSWSPDGERITFISTRDGGRNLYLLEDGESRLLYESVRGGAAWRD